MKRIGKLDICGIPFDLIEGTPAEYEGLQNAYGYCNALGCQIVVREGLPTECFRNTVLHEAQHAIWEHSGLSQLSEADWKKIKEFEEAFIQTFTPHLIRLLKSFKSLRVKS